MSDLNDKVDEYIANLKTAVESAEHHESEDWNRMTGQEWYNRFKAEYHNKADWIAADESMGDDAEHDVLLAARLAAGLPEDSK